MEIKQTVIISYAPHPWGAVLYPGSGNLLLVDDVHQSRSVDASNVDHRPLQRVPDPQVELHGREGEREKKSLKRGGKAA